ncbi:MAG: hypothetical protein HY925_09330, partial [Elusimicrobia bacterium]|nr:hypothetical protein [Elusimicrobiota bacterium]
MNAQTLRRLILAAALAGAGAARAQEAPTVRGLIDAVRTRAAWCGRFGKLSINPKDFQPVDAELAQLVERARAEALPNSPRVAALEPLQDAVGRARETLSRNSKGAEVAAALQAAAEAGENFLNAGRPAATNRAPESGRAAAPPEPAVGKAKVDWVSTRGAELRQAFETRSEEVPAESGSGVNAVRASAAKTRPAAPSNGEGPRFVSYTVPTPGTAIAEMEAQTQPGTYQSPAVAVEAARAAVGPGLPVPGMKMTQDVLLGLIGKSQSQPAGAPSGTHKAPEKTSVQAEPWVDFKGAKLPAVGGKAAVASAGEFTASVHGRTEIDRIGGYQVGGSVTTDGVALHGGYTERGLSKSYTAGVSVTPSSEVRVDAGVRGNSGRGTGAYLSPGLTRDGIRYGAELSGESGTDSQGPSGKAMFRVAVTNQKVVDAVLG